MNDEIIKKINEFIQKTRTREWILTSSANDVLASTKFGTSSTLTRELAKVMGEYERSNSEDPDIWEITNRFNNLINLAITYDVIKEGKKPNHELNELQDKCVKYENQIKELESMTEQLQNEISTLKERIRIHCAMYPDLKRLDVQESEVTDE